MPERKKLRPQTIRIRKIVQIFFFVLIASISINHTLSESGQGWSFLSNASLHALCPFGGVVTIYQYATSGSFVQKIHESAFTLMAIGFLLAILFGPAFCGWVCPLGTAQEWVSILGKKIFKKRFNHFLPQGIDRIFRFFRYLVLAWVVYLTAATGTLIFSSYDPYFALFNLWSDELALGGVIILAITLLLSLFVERPWCKYACPYGAVQGVFNLFRIFSIRRNIPTCINCAACSRECPMNIAVDKLSLVRDHQCISCLECTSEAACPVAITVTFSSRGVK